MANAAACQISPLLLPFASGFYKDTISRPTALLAQTDPATDLVKCYAQMQSPFFPEGVTHIAPLLAFSKQDGRITHFNGDMPVFAHDVEDIDSFRMFPMAAYC